MASWPEFRPTALIGALVEAGVDFVVIGGVAVVVQASPRFTRDLDITYATDTANLERLGALLVALEARLRGVEEDSPFTPDARALRHTQTLTLTTRDGDLDLLANPPGSPGYPALRRRADVVKLEGKLRAHRIARGPDRDEAGGRAPAGRDRSRIPRDSPQPHPRQTPPAAHP